MTDHQKQPTVELYVRSLAPSGTTESQIRTIQCLETLAETGAIGAYSVEVVGRGVLHEPCCLTTETGKQLLDRLDSIEEWATEHAASVPGIDTVTVETSLVHERAYAMTTLPSQLLFEYDGAELVFVSPATVESTHVSVAEHLERLGIAPQDDAVHEPEPIPSQ